jgi:hypothetical protein
MKGINPAWVFYIGIAITIEQAIGQGAVPLTNVVPADWIPYITADCSLLAFIGTVVMTALSGYSSKQSGPLVSAPSLPPAAKSVIAFFAILALALIFAMPAMAATSSDPLTALMAKIQTVQTETIAAVVIDINAADADASAISPTTNQMNDQIAHACYPAAVKFLQSLPSATKPTGKFTGVQLFQKKRDFLAQLQAGLPVYLKLGCAPLLGDEIQTFISIMGMVGVKILPAALTAAVPVLAPITVPALTLAP